MEYLIILGLIAFGFLFGLLVIKLDGRDVRFWRRRDEEDEE